MNKKSKVILSSALAIAMSASVIAGGTFALFTSEDQVNVAVTAGRVEITATAGGLETYSLGTEDLGGAWTNGGAATVEANSVTLNNITPGDKAKFDVSIKNNSNVNILYRTIVEVVEDTGLMSGLEISVGGKTFVGFACSDWKLIQPEAEGVEELQKDTVVIELPKAAGNEYFDKNARLIYKVEAVQGNADYDKNDYQYQNPLQGNIIRNALDLKYFAAQVNAGKTFEGETVYLSTDIDLEGKPMMPIGTKDKKFLGKFKSLDASTISTVASEEEVAYTVSNFVVNNVDCGGLFGYAGSNAHRTTIENVNVANATINANRRAGGIVGYIAGSVKGCSVSNTTITVAPQLINNRHYENGDKVGGVVGHGFWGNYTDNKVTNVVVTGYRDIGGILGAVTNENGTVKVTDNVLNNVQVAFDKSDIQTVEGGEVKVRANADIVAGRKIGTITMERNELVNAVSPTQSLVETEKAFSAAVESGGEITMQKDMVVEERVVIEEGKEVVIEMNDSTINNSVKNNGTATFVGGAIEQNAVGMENYGEATFTDVDMKAGSDKDYSNISYKDSVTVYNNVNIGANGGGIAATDGAEVTFNSGSVALNATTTNPRYNFYAEGEGTVITINSGTFSFNNRTLKRAYIYAGAGTTVYVTGGVFGAPSTRKGYTAGILGEGNVIISGGTFGFDPTEWLAEGYAAVKEGEKYIVISAAVKEEGEKLGATFTTEETVVQEKLAGGESVVLLQDTVLPDTQSNGYGSTGVNVNGGVLNGNGNEIGAPNANGTWDSAINVTGGAIKNVKVVSGFRGIFVNHNSTTCGEVILENVIIDGPVYTISCDQGTNNGLKATNCTFNGWTSYAKSIGNVSFTNCNFGEGSGYAFCRPYAPTTFTGCNFEAGYVMEPCAAVTLSNCYIDGVLITESNVTELVTSVANVTVANN